MFSLLRPYIFGLDPEVAHDLAIKSLKFNVLPKAFFHVDEEEMLETELFKKKLKNFVQLKIIKQNKELSNLSLIKQSRLSVMPIDSKSWKIICKMGKI